MPPPGVGGPPGLDPTGGMGAPDPSDPQGAMALITPLVMAQQQQVEGLKAQQAQAMAQAMAAAMQNTQNPAGAAAATLPGDPTAPGSGGPPPGFSPSAPPQGTY